MKALISLARFAWSSLLGGGGTVFSPAAPPLAGGSSLWQPGAAAAPLLPPPRARARGEGGEVAGAGVPAAGSRPGLSTRRRLFDLIERA